jgi:PAS domain S-box-containing protein
MASLPRSAADQGRVPLLAGLRDDAYRLLFEDHPQPMWLFDAETFAFLVVNDAAVRKYGYSREEFLARTLLDIRPPEDVARLLEVVARGRQRGDAIDEAVHRCKDGTILNVTVTVSYATLEGRPVGLAIPYDVTDRQRALEAAEAGRREAEILAGLARAIGATLDVDVVLQQAVEAAWQLSASDLAVIALRDPHSDTMRIRYEAGQSRSGVYKGFTLERGKGIGGLAWERGWPVRTDNRLEDPRISRDYDHAVHDEGIVTTLAVPILIDNEVEGLLWVNNRSPRPFTERDEVILIRLATYAAIALRNAQLFEHVQSANERLAALSRQLIEVQEAERRHLARELHDDLGQLLTVLWLNLVRLREDPGPLRSEQLDESLRSVSHLVEEVRSRSLDLHPSVLDDLGLVPALEWYVERHAGSAGLSATVSAEPGGLRWPPEIEGACFRVTQEALTNVARHARARNVRVELRRLPSALELTIRDDGVGFDVEAARRNAMQGESLGLLGMQERVQLAGGRLTIDSTPGAGTRIRVSFPAAPA